MLAAAYAMSSWAPGQKKPLAGHGMGVALPVGAQKPASTGMQPSSEARSVAFDDVPPGHGMGVAVPLGQYEPGEHDWHSVAPDASWCLPMGHNAQTSCLANAPDEPGRHAVGSADPTAQLVPSGHTMH